MISDKFFAIKTAIMGAGLFDFFKAIARTIDQYMGKALNDTRKNAKSWADTIINGIFYVIDAVAILSNVFRGLEIVWAGLKIAVLAMGTVIIGTLNDIADIIRKVINLIPNVKVTPFETLSGVTESLKSQLKDTQKELIALVKTPLPSTNVQKLRSDLVKNFKEVRAEAAKTKDAIANSGEGFKDERTDDQKLTEQLDSGEIEIPKQTISPYTIQLQSTGNRRIPDTGIRIQGATG